jgi:hypothetical protein
MYQKDQPGGLFPLKDQVRIIDLVTRNRAQDKFKEKPQMHVRLHDDLPLSGRALRLITAGIMTSASNGSTCGGRSIS